MTKFLAWGLTEADSCRAYYRLRACFKFAYYLIMLFLETTMLSLPGNAFPMDS